MKKTVGWVEVNGVRTPDLTPEVDYEYGAAIQVIEYTDTEVTVEIGEAPTLLEVEIDPTTGKGIIRRKRG